MLKGQLTPELIQQASKMTGESPANTGSALTTLAPMLLHAFADKGSSPSGATQLLGALSDNKIEGGMLGSLTSMLGGSGSSTLLSAGSALLPMLLGGKSSGIFDKVASMAGVKSGSSSMLGSIMSLLIGGLISKQVAGGGLNASSLASLLGGQKSMLASALPAGLGDMLGVGNLGANAASTATGAIKSGTSAVMGAAGTATKPARAGGSSIMKWLLPLLAVLAIGYLAWSFFGPKTPTLNVKAVACTPIAAIDSAVGGTLPTINTDTKSADIKAWLASVKPIVEGLINTGTAAGLPISGIKDAYTKLDSVIAGVSTDTLGAAADPINAAISTFKGATGTLKTTAGCQ